MKNRKIENIKYYKYKNSFDIGSYNKSRDNNDDNNHVNGIRIFKSSKFYNNEENEEGSNLNKSINNNNKGNLLNEELCIKIGIEGGYILPELLKNSRNLINDHLKSKSFESFNNDDIFKTSQIQDNSSKKELKSSFDVLSKIENLKLSSPKNNKYFKKLIKLKQYDTIVENLTKVKNLIIFNQKFPKLSSPTSPGHILPKILQKNNSAIDFPNSTNDKKLKKNKSMSNLKNLSRNTNNEELGKNTLQNKNHKIIDPQKLNFLKIYKTSEAEEELLKNVKFLIN